MGESADADYLKFWSFGKADAKMNRSQRPRFARKQPQEVVCRCSDGGGGPELPLLDRAGSLTWAGLLGLGAIGMTKAGLGNEVLIR